MSRDSFTVDPVWLAESQQLVTLRQAQRTNDLSLLDIRMKNKINQLMYLCRKEGIRFHILETYRHPEVQNALYLQGRAPWSVVNQARRLVGMPMLDVQDNFIVTYAQGSESYHSKGLAIDYIAVNKYGKRTFNYALMKRIGTIATRIGLTWGGNWKCVDIVHIELRV